MLSPAKKGKRNPRRVRKSMTIKFYITHLVRYFNIGAVSFGGNNSEPDTMRNVKTLL